MRPQDVDQIRYIVGRDLDPSELATFDSLVGGDTSVKNRVDAFACVPPGRPAIGTQFRLLRTSNWSRKGARDDMERP